ncbi:Uncharacterized membrane-anchored protein YitT, contains DUF161 and DUF2179 domains [Hathewaya proteolytica DSM 3090]|uniref:Uncharacterized membrane-anchored protein YitT, contains DUF161 and DUF2179 domains n=1 Tax=Hathewaya proteolytica DSM 3090 TaxID=1121331 RepID=A0A1M6JP49_9CLOT|nr:YitT family protein [Hathewaya proteolytica]SHJ48497.1 Uncharacterized membrane-anchored protein YitT, contains DUF161 and DUF2179 domains [Hathewaya proteolytica DSM 3090]
MKITKQTAYEYGLIMVGCTILGFAINQFITPNNLVMGGIAGIAVILQYFASIPVWLTNIIVNVPLLLVSIKQKGFKFVGRTVFAVIYLSFAMWYTEYIPLMLKNSNIFLSSIFGGIALGLGVGLVLRASASTGGTDTVAALLHDKFKSVSIATFLNTLNSAIIIIGALVFGVEIGLYGLISVYISSKVVSMILEGMHFAKAALIISDKMENVSTALNQNIKRGATIIKGRGMYTKQEKDMIYMVVSEKQIFQLQKVVKSVDPTAFIIISDVREVLGEGFQNEALSDN